MSRSRPHVHGIVAGSGVNLEETDRERRARISREEQLRAPYVEMYTKVLAAGWRLFEGGRVPEGTTRDHGWCDLCGRLVLCAEQPALCGTCRGSRRR